MDKAISSDMTKNFTKAFAEGYPDFKGKMHVYLMDIGALGSWVDESPVSGKAKAGYILLSTKLKDRFPESWQLLMKGECFHEYFHGIQSAYNWESDRWFLEATSTWAMGYYANDFMHIKPLYNGSNSIFTLPNDILWSMVGARQYSASALAFYLSEKFDGHKIIKSYLVNSITEKDAIKNLQQILLAKGTTFSEEYTCFLASLFSKKITSIKKYMPDVSIATTHNTYGLDTTTGNVFLTGANFHVFDPEAGVQPASFIATFTAGTTGVPRGVLVKQKSKTPIPFQAHAVIGSPAAYVGDFGGNVEQVVLIVTDTDYSAQDTDLRPYEYAAIVPRVVVKEVLAQSPIYSGESSQIDITYDLLGTFPGKPFPAQLKVTEKGPDVTDNASGEGELASGVDQILGLWFSTSWDTVGTYRFTFQLAVPPDSWLPIPQVKSKGRCSVVVEEPPEESAVGQLQPKVQTESAALRIRR
jgi:hypothetical protein